MVKEKTKKTLLKQGVEKKILVVEDTAAIAEVMKLKLDKSGFPTTIAENGEEAIKILTDNTFDLILLDLIMPKLDGFGVLATMKKMKIKTPVIITTNLGQPEDMAKVKNFGVKDYFLKVDMPLAEMVERIKKVLVS